MSFLPTCHRHREHRKLASKLIDRVGREDHLLLESEFNDWEDVGVETHRRQRNRRVS